MRLTMIAVTFMVSIIGAITTTDYSSERAQPFRREAVSYSLFSSKITLHEPVIIEFTLNNVFAESIKVDLGADRKEAFRFAVTQPDGVSRNLLLLRQEGIARFGSITLQPGQSYRQRLLINEWTDFPLPGKYLVAVRLVNPVQTQKGLVIAKDAGFRATLEVAPKDPEKLRSVCETLFSQMAASKSYEQAAEAILALSHIRDPVAVPYLEKSLVVGKLVEPFAIKGLAQIGNREAVQALISALNMRNRDIATLAQAALSKLEAESSDPALKDQIKRALKRAP